MAEVPSAFGRRALPQLVQQIEAFMQEGSAALAATLRTFAALVASQEAKCEAVSLGAPALLVQLLKISETRASSAELANPTVTTLVYTALRRLAAVPAGRAALVRAGGVGALAAELRDGPARGAAVNCMEAMSNHPDGAAALLAPAHGIVAALARSMCTAAGCGELACLGNLLAADRGVEDALAAGLPAILVELAEKMLLLPASGGVGKKGCEANELLACALCLQHICRLPAGQRAVQAAGGIACLCCIDASGSGKLAQSAASSLRAIAIGAEGKEAFGAGAGQALARLLCGPDAGAASAAAIALRNAAEHPRVRHALAELLASVPAAHKAACRQDLPELPAEWRYAVRAPPRVPLPVFASRDLGDLHS
ncbi:hypothetical protein WJX81_006935 [Elliptochloris bilobata]|uniref:Armadillo repeat-containing protein 8 n=1 Tax=Elliptochloris bilobata TaxID=381761 RepID=A0AAW1RVZ4_9CHLO